MRRFHAVVASALLLVGFIVPGFAQGVPQVCRAGQTDAHERPAPEALLPRIARAFAVAPDLVRHGSFIRCDAGRLLACEVGANLNCGLADVSRHSVGGNNFCRDRPGSAVVPMVATGHNSIYAWTCRGTRAIAGRKVMTVDRQGFTAENWHPVP